MRKLGTVFVIIGALLICGALFLLLRNTSEDKQAGESASTVLGGMKEAIVSEHIATEAPHLPSETEIPAELPHVDPYNEQEVLQSYEMRVVEIDGWGYIGYLSIPKLGLELPIMNEIDYDGLKIAPCRMTGSVKSGDMIIAGHNYSRHFGNLKELEVGDAVYFTDMDGVERMYLVSELLVLEPIDIAGMNAGVWDMTLFTCTYGGAKRVTVRLTELKG